MLIETKGKEDCLEKGCFTGEPDIIEASELLYNLLDTSYRCSRTCLETEINGQREDIRSLYWKCKELMEQIGRGGEKTSFLSMSVLEQTFEQAYPLMLVKLEDIAGGDDSQIKAVHRLKQIFRENPYKELWLKKSEQYRGLIEKLGFSVHTTDYADLTAIMHPLLDAFTLYKGEKHRYPPTIYKIRDGKRSAKRPEMAASICKYASEKEFVDALAGCGRESVMAFGAIEKTNRMLDDGFSRWFYGYPDERQRNFMTHDHLTEEEYLDSVCDYSRCVYLGVKSADTIWIMKMPYKKDNYGRLDDASSKYYYGKRAGYAPYEVFYKEPPAAPADTTFLAIPQKGWKLSEIMDEGQKIWLPVFLEESYEKFFWPEEPEAETLFLPQELRADIPGRECLSIVPVIPSLPCTMPAYRYQVRTPQMIFSDEPQMITLIELLDVKVEDIADAPILPAECMTGDRLEKELEKKERQAYIKIIAGKITELTVGKKQVRRQMIDFMKQNEGVIVERAARGEFDSFTEIVIDGAPELDKNGNPVMKRKNTWSREEVPSIIRTTKREGKRTPWESLARYDTQAVWISPETSGNPPVVWKIRPKTTKDYSVFLGIDMEILPTLLRYLNELDWFCKTYENEVPQVYKNSYGDGPSIYPGRFAAINLCMTKRVYKAFRKTK